MNIWDIIVAIILGIVEGLTEYAPDRKSVV